jgi:hypothetical protein
MEKPKTSLPAFDHDRLAACLRAQAKICEKAASMCWNEEIASKFEGLARECSDAAASLES